MTKMSPATRLESRNWPEETTSEMRSHSSLGNLDFGYFPDAVALARWRVNPNLEGNAAISLRV